MAEEAQHDPTEDLLDNVELEEDKQESSDKASVEDDRPERSDPKWASYVLGLLEDDETTDDGFPSADGLQRVAEGLIGEIINSFPTVHQCPNKDNEYHAVVQWTIVFDTNPRKQFSDVADVCGLNTPDLKYAKHASSTAASKARGRALRIALGLRKVITAEEASPANLEQNDKVDDSQIHFMNMVCAPQRCNINVRKLINLSKNLRGIKIRDIPFAAAAKINAYLNECQSGTRAVPEEIKGYQYGWEDDE